MVAMHTDEAVEDRPIPPDRIEITDLTKIYGENTAESTTAIEDIDLEITSGAFVSILGPSGCGKTTLLKCVGDLVEPTSGEIRIGEDQPRKARQDRRMAFYFQEDVLLPWKTVMENVLLPFVIQGRNPDDQAVQQQAKEVIERVGLSGFETQKPAQLSGGMRQRVALARGFVYDPEIFLMDEPFAALDELTRRKMNTELLQIHQDLGKTTVFVTHHIPEAVYLSDRVVVLTPRPGQIDEIVEIDLARPRDEDTRQSDAFHEYEDRLTEKLIVEE